MTKCHSTRNPWCKPLQTTIDMVNHAFVFLTLEQFHKNLAHILQSSIPDSFFNEHETKCTSHLLMSKTFQVGQYFAASILQFKSSYLGSYPSSMK